MLVSLGAAPRAAEARTARIYSYPLEQVWPAALRFLRLDEGGTIVEKDAEAGYVVFELAPEGHDEPKSRIVGTLELARTQDDDGRQATKALLHLRNRPSYREQAMLERLARKLLDELGDPADPPSPPAHTPGKKDKKNPRE